MAATLWLFPFWICCLLSWQALLAAAKVGVSVMIMIMVMHMATMAMSTRPPATSNVSASRFASNHLISSLLKAQLKQSSAPLGGEDATQKRLEVMLHRLLAFPTWKKELKRCHRLFAGKETTAHGEEAGGALLRPAPLPFSKCTKVC